MMARVTRHKNDIDRRRVCFDDRRHIADLQGLRTHRTPQCAECMALASLTGDLGRHGDAVRLPISLRNPQLAAGFVLKAP